VWKDPILVIEKPDFIVILHKELIEVDLKETGKAKLEAAIEKDPHRIFFGLNSQTLSSSAL